MFFTHCLRFQDVFGDKIRLSSVTLEPRVDPLTSSLAAMARSCQILSTSWQPWQDSY